MKWFHCVFFHHYFDLNERASRREYWWYTLVVIVIFVWCGFLSLILSDNPREVVPVIFLAISLAILSPSWSLLVRRLHDTSRSGWWGMLIFLPVVGWLVLLFFLMKKGHEYENRFGLPPVYFFE